MGTRDNGVYFKTWDAKKKKKAQPRPTEAPLDASQRN